MQVILEQSIIQQLSSKGILAYLAVRLAEGKEATTASLAARVKCQTGVMLEGLKELAVVAPGAVGRVGRNKSKWVCGEVKVNGATVELPNSDTERYRTFVDDLKKFWDFVNANAVPFSMGGKDGLQIRTFLSSHREWTEDDWRTALRNRAKSVMNYQAASKTEPLWVWVSKLDIFLAGPMDRYGKPVEGDGGKQGQIQQRNSSAAEVYLNGSKRA